MSRRPVRTKCIACGNSYLSSHRFYSLPKNDELRKKWLVLLKCEDIIDLDPKFLSNNARVCDKHFQEWAFTSSLRDRLIRSALPNSDPPAIFPILDPKLCEVIKKPQYRVLKLSKAHIEELKKKQGKIIWNRTSKPSRLSTEKNGHSEQPSSLPSIDGNCDQPSSPASVDGNCDQPSLPASVGGNRDQTSSPVSIDRNCDQPSSLASIDGNCNQPSLSASKDGNCEQPSFSFSVASKDGNCEQTSFSFSVIRHSKPLSLPKSSSLTQKYKPNKKENIKEKYKFIKKAQHDRSDLHQLISSQRKEIYNQRRIIKKMKQKMEALRNENLKFQKTVMDKLNTERYGFLRSLIKQLGSKKVGGMRWTEKDKEFANACFVLSPKVYKMLRFKLGFPSQSTLRRIGVDESSKAANQVSDEPNRVVNQMSDESNEAVNQMSESNREINQMDESNESVIQMSESGETLEVDESTISVNQLMGQGQTLQVNESTGAFFRFIESMESMNESQVREVVEIIESVP